MANAFGAHLSGLVAWIVWAFIHIIYIVIPESPFIKWAIQDLAFSRGARLITGVALRILISIKKLLLIPARRKSQPRQLPYRIEEAEKPEIAFIEDIPLLHWSESPTRGDG